MEPSRSVPYRRLGRFIATAFMALAGSLALAQAQVYPARSISVVVPYGAGGGTDLFARGFATELAARLKQNVIVENVPGAGGTVGVQRVMTAQPDGYTLVVSNGIEFEMLQMADPESAKGRTTKLAPVALFGTQPMVLVARPGLGLKTADDFVKAAKAKPGALSLASSGPGTSLHLAGEMIKKAAGIELLNVPYKSAPQIVTDLIAGNVDVAVLALPTAIGHVKGGTLTALGITDVVRSPALPDVPPLRDTAAFRGIDTKVWYAIFGPQGMPAPVVKTLNDAASAMLKEPQFREKLVSLMITPPQTGSVEELETVKTQQLGNFQRALGR